MADTKPEFNLLEMLEAFDTDVECRKYLEDLRWPDGVRCPRCQSKSISRLKQRKVFDCDGCRYQFSVTAGTIFHDSHLPLPKWFAAIFLICESKKGMSANQLKRILKVSYKTAWYLCHRIREAMRVDGAPMLTGTVEVDETYVGGRRRGHNARRGRPTGDHKTMVLAAIARGGDVRLRVEKRATKKLLHGFINENCAPETANIYTDELPSYAGIADGDTKHETVKHSVGEYVRGDVHTNTVEGVFSLFKRSVIGSFHQVSKKHLDRYLDEFEFRFNNRKNRYLFRDVVNRLCDGKALPYTKLTA